jgi:hypothetical protein
MAREIYQLSNVTLPMNIFTLGLIFAFFLTGGIHPFALQNEERIVNIKKRQPIVITANQLLNVTGAAKVFNLISLMLNFDAAQRPVAPDILAFLNEQQSLIVGCHSHHLQTESSEDGRHSSLVELPPPDEEETQDNAYSTAQIQESIPVPSYSSSQSQTLPSVSSSGLQQQDQEADSSNRQLSTNKRRIDNYEGAAAKTIKLENSGNILSLIK